MKNNETIVRSRRVQKGLSELSAGNIEAETWMELPMKMCPGQSLRGGNELEGGSGNQRRAVEPERSQLGKDWVQWGWTGSEDQVREDLASHGQEANFFSKGQGKAFEGFEQRSDSSKFIFKSLNAKKKSLNAVMNQTEETIETYFFCGQSEIWGQSLFCPFIFHTPLQAVVGIRSEIGCRMLLATRFFFSVCLRVAWVKAEGQDVVSARGDHQPFLREPRTGPVTAQLVTEDPTGSPGSPTVMIAWN